jgi:hypothetical protein
MNLWLRRLALALVLLGGFSAPSRPLVISIEASQKTVHVKGYTKKDGTKVEPYDREAPEKKSTKAESAPAPKPKATSASKPAKQRAVITASSQPRDSKGRFVRSASGKHAFEVQSGYPKGRPGYVVDHIKPLACGGVDTPSNMQWQTVADAKVKEKVELAGCR